MANNIRAIWETDPDAKPKERTFSNDYVGRFRSGRLVGKQPESLNEWRVTTGDPVVAAKVAELLGGTPEPWSTEKEDNLEVLSDSASVEIIIENSDALDASMKLFGMSGLIHHCDGVKFLSPEEEKGDPCGCPASFQDRKDKAKAQRGPKPSVDLTFKLADAPELGLFRFNSGSWELVKVLHNVIADIDKTGGREYADDDTVLEKGVAVRATLSIENVSYTTKAGRDVSYNKPVIKVTGTAEAAQPADLPMAA
ncbi:hypothetical protein [Streptomyces sp. SID2119]|uniref:recombination directionality factor n=1 Tax=Streptomyces sp. SID2119 TaxID=2690253 RepID=UPI00136DEF36|nr:hypothetical protein [Streptomyces sp. SID2119]MYW28339.1 hypothetical protein [Streptomyces sp. SID2119]